MATKKTFRYSFIVYKHVLWEIEESPTQGQESLHKENENEEHMG